jgi:hypothetical protein
MNAQLHANPEEYYVESEVYGMRARETYEVAPRGLAAEGEITGGIIVYEETYHIARGISHIHLYHQLQKVINKIVYRSRETTIQHKAHKLRLSLLCIFKLLGFLLQT